MALKVSEEFSIKIDLAHLGLPLDVKELAEKALVELVDTPVKIHSDEEVSKFISEVVCASPELVRRNHVYVSAEGMQWFIRNYPDIRVHWVLDRFYAYYMGKGLKRLDSAVSELGMRVHVFMHLEAGKRYTPRCARRALPYCVYVRRFYSDRAKLWKASALRDWFDDNFSALTKFFENKLNTAILDLRCDDWGMVKVADLYDLWRTLV